MADAFPVQTDFSSGCLSLSFSLRFIVTDCHIMSARPRPVTATFQPASMKPHTGVRERCYSLSSDGSTASLISVLDHLSCEEEDFSLQQSPEHTRERRQQINHDELPQTDDNAKVVTWRMWVVEKARQDLEKQQTKVKELKKKQEEQQKKADEEKEKKKKCEQKYQEWVDKKTQELTLKKKRNTREKKVENALEDEKKRDIEEKSVEKYKEWAKVKAKKKKEQKMIDEALKEKKEEEKRLKEEKSQEAFKQWCQKAKNRPSSSYSNYENSSGRITGLSDTFSQPAPGFYNPMPWTPVEIPKPKKERKSKRPAYKWKPDKYL